MATKHLIHNDETGLTVYAIIVRESDGYLLNDADGTFAVAPADPYLALTEHSTVKGRYKVEESRQVWTDGRYSTTIYSQVGGSPAPVTDTVIGSGEMYVVSDAEIILDASAAAIKGKTDNLPADPASQTKIDFVEKWILNRLVESPDGTTFTLYDTDNVTPLKVWAYSSGTKTRSKAT